MQYLVSKIHRNEFVFNMKEFLQIKYKLDVRIDLLVKQINIDASLKEMYLLLLEISFLFSAEHPRYPRSRLTSTIILFIS